jgi:hypothetical protein
VPKANFPEGLPPIVAQALATDEEIEDMEVRGGGTVDNQTYYIVDQEVSRQLLGRHVVILELDTGTDTRARLPPAVEDGALGPSGTVHGHGTRTVVTEHRGGGADVTLRSRSRSRSRGRGPAGTAHGNGARGMGPAGRERGGGADAAGPAGGTYSAGRERGLEKVLSDASETEEPEAKKAKEMVSVMKSLRDEIAAAMEKGHWYPTHKLQHANVQDLIGELLEVIKGMAGDTTGLFTKIGCWLEREILARPVYSVLEKFTGLFGRLTAAGAEVLGAGALIDALAAVPKDSDETLDIVATSGANVLGRTSFRKSALHGSFVEHRTNQVIQKAKGASGQARLDILESARGLPGLPDGMSETISIASTLFNEKVPLMQRVQFLATPNSVAVKLAIDWDRAGHMGTAASWFTMEPELKTIPMDLLYDLARIFNDPVEKLGSLVLCPILQGTLSFLASVHSARHDDWNPDRLVEAAVCLRVGRVASLDPPFAASEIPPCAGCVLKPTVLYLSFVRGAQPQWLLDWKDLRAAEKTTKRDARGTQVPPNKDGEDTARSAGGGESNKAESAPPTHTPSTILETPEGGGEAQDGDASDGARERRTDEEVPQVARPEAGCPAPGMFAVGDLVVGHATKYKSHYHMQKAEVTAVLAQHYKVTLLEGDSEGASHKYLHRTVALFAPAAAEAAGGAPAAADFSSGALALASGGAPAAVAASGGLQELETLWD